MCVKWELVWVSLPCFVQLLGFCSSSNELWKPWLGLVCLIATGEEGECWRMEARHTEIMWPSPRADRPQLGVLEESSV